MRKLIFTPFLFIFLGIYGCRNHKSIKAKLDLTTFQQVEEFTMFENLSFTDSFSYYEARYGLCDNLEFDVLYKQGEKCADSDDPITCGKDLERIIPSAKGFHRNCSPGCCHHYLVTEKAGIIKTWATTSQLKKLLGAINTSNEALLWAYAYGYYFMLKDKKNGAVKRIEDGYQLIALKLMNECAPYQVDRFLLNVLEDGTFVIEEQELYTKENTPCP